MTIILRLDPALPPLWRSPDALQFGVPAVTVVSPVEAWHLRMITELTSGLPESAVMVWAEILRVDPARVRAFVASLSPVLLRIDPDLPPRLPRVLLHSARAGGDAGMLAALRGVCADAGIEVARPFHAAGGPASISTGTAPDAQLVARVATENPNIDLVILLAHHTVDPRTSAALLSADITQLPVVMTTHGMRIGPLIIPGRTACLHCAELHRIDIDPAWPTMATQLLELVAPAPSPLVVLEAAALTARFVTAAVLAGDDARLRDASVSVRAGSAHRQWQRHRPHPSCGCLSLAQSATLPEARDQQNVRTKATAMRVPA